jgi:SHS family lactate transporter-like MFS transporter
MQAARVSPARLIPSVSKQVSSDQNAAVIASFLGWTLDAFDYFLVVYCLTAIGKEFNRSDLEMAFSITLTLAFRPVGAFIFGLLADRYGRRLPLMLDLVFFSIVEVATAFAPNYTSFLILRALFGIGMGGEWGAGASLTMEKVSPRLRGLFSGLLNQGYSWGNLLAAICYFTMFQRWGWRPMFLLGGLPALLAIFIRLRVKESEVWEETRADNWSHLGKLIFSHWKLFLYITILMTFMNLSSHGVQDMYPTFLQRYWHFDPAKRSIISAIASVGALCGSVTFACYSNSRGRRRAIIMGLLLGLAVIPLWAWAPTSALLITGAFMINFMIQGSWGVIPAHLAEMSPDPIRGFLPGFAYQCGVLLSSSIVMIQALLARHLSYPATMAITAAVVFLGGILIAGLGRERRGRAFGVGAD